jgi:hypothetical protein
MFRYERELEAPAARWLARQGLAVRREFETPVGVCDVVGCALDGKRARLRQSLKQTSTLGPPTRVELWHQIPDRASKRCTTLEELVDRFGSFWDRAAVEQELDRLIGHGFVSTTSNGKLQRRSPWHPLQKRIVAIELKLTRVTEALAQAVRCAGFADEAFVGVPHATAVYAAGCRSAEFERAGVGLLAIRQHSVQVLIAPRPRRRSVFDPIARTHAVERFWRAYLTDSSA